MQDIKFKALFEHIPSGTKLWQISTVDHTLQDAKYLVRKSEWLQYVGKKDIHDHEIYEGDVFRFKYMEELHYPIVLIGSFVFGNDLSFEIDILNNNSYTCLRYIDNGQFYDFELLGGNIKETPDFTEKLLAKTTMIEIDEEWNEAVAHVKAVKNGEIIDEESFTTGHGASTDNRSEAHTILIQRVHKKYPEAKIKGFFTGQIIAFEES